MFEQIRARRKALGVPQVRVAQAVRKSLAWAQQVEAGAAPSHVWQHSVHDRLRARRRGKAYVEGAYRPGSGVG